MHFITLLYMFIEKEVVTSFAKCHLETINQILYHKLLVSFICRYNKLKLIHVCFHKLLKSGCCFVSCVSYYYFPWHVSSFITLPLIWEIWRINILYRFGFCKYNILLQDLHSFLHTIGYLQVNVAIVADIFVLMSYLWMLNGF